MDKVSSAVRSKVMAAIRGRGNKSTELALLALLRLGGIKGWRRHYPIAGRPDFAFPKQRIALFVDGCFWHGCPVHYRFPTSNVAYWQGKIDGNRHRDRVTATALRAKGWKVVRIWEHALRKSGPLLARLHRLLGAVVTPAA